MIIGLGWKIFDPKIKPKPKLSKFNKINISSRVNLCLF